VREPHGDFVGTDAAAAKLAELRSRPGMAEQLAAIRADFYEDDEPTASRPCRF
jgi:hypothetical protein